MLTNIDRDTINFIEHIKEKGNKFSGALTLYGILYTNHKPTINGFEAGTEQAYEIDANLNIRLFHASSGENSLRLFRGITLFHVWIDKDLDVSEELAAAIKAATTTVKHLYAPCKVVSYI